MAGGPANCADDGVVGAVTNRSDHRSGGARDL
jgi:hypothetical protein